MGNLFIRNLMFNIITLNNFFQKSVISDEIAKTCFGGSPLGEAKWTNFWPTLLYINGDPKFTRYFWTGIVHFRLGEK